MHLVSLSHLLRYVSPAFCTKTHTILKSPSPSFAEKMEGQWRRHKPLPCNELVAQACGVYVKRVTCRRFEIRVWVTGV